MGQYGTTYPLSHEGDTVLVPHLDSLDFQCAHVWLENCDIDRHCTTGVTPVGVPLAGDIVTIVTVTVPGP